MTCHPTHVGWVIGIGAALGAILGAAFGHVGVWIAVGAAVALLPVYAIQRKNDAPK